MLLAHGAGADRNALPLVVTARALAAAGIPSLRFDFPYRAAGRKAPDRPPVLLAAVREAAAELAALTGLPPDRLVLGGRSMGGRYCSLAVGRRRGSAPRPRAAAPRLSAPSGREARATSGSTISPV